MAKKATSKKSTATKKAGTKKATATKKTGTKKATATKKTGTKKPTAIPTIKSLQGQINYLQDQLNTNHGDWKKLTARVAELEDTQTVQVVAAALDAKGIDPMVALGNKIGAEVKERSTGRTRPKKRDQIKKGKKRDQIKKRKKNKPFKRAKKK